MRIFQQKKTSMSASKKQLEQLLKLFNFCKLQNVNNVMFTCYYNHDRCEDILEENIMHAYLP